MGLNNADQTRPTNAPDVNIAHTEPRSKIKAPKRGRRLSCGSCAAAFAGLFIGVCLSLYLIAPLRTNVLLLGLDRSFPGTKIARTDTMILTTFLPHRPYVAALSIPRDLWVSIPNIGQNRINTAYYFAESQFEGSGAQAAKEAIQTNFGIDVHYFLLVEFVDLVQFIDSIGGVTIELEGPTGGLAEGVHQLDGQAALRFIRDRQGTDDFFRMRQGQIFIRSLIRKLLNPIYWPRLAIASFDLFTSLDSDIPVWLWPRLLITLFRVGADGIDGRIIDRDFVNPFQTANGASVLAPDWERINPVLLEMFGQ